VKSVLKSLTWVLEKLKSPTSKIRVDLEVKRLKSVTWGSMVIQADAKHQVKMENIKFIYIFVIRIYEADKMLSYWVVGTPTIPFGPYLDQYSYIYSYY
jgi:hypothetical protein